MFARADPSLAGSPRPTQSHASQCCFFHSDGQKPDEVQSRRTRRVGEGWGGKSTYKVSRDAASNSLHLSRRKKRGCSGSNDLSLCCCCCCRFCSGRGSALLLPSFLSISLPCTFTCYVSRPSSETLRPGNVRRINENVNPRTPLPPQ